METKGERKNRKIIKEKIEEWQTDVQMRETDGQDRQRTDKSKKRKMMKFK